MRPRQGGKHTALLMAVLFFAADLAFAQTLGPSTGWQFPPTKVAGVDCARTPASIGDRRTPSHGSVVALRSGDDRAPHRTVVQRPPGVPLAAVRHGVADRESLEQFQPWQTPSSRTRRVLSQRWL